MFKDRRAGPKRKHNDMMGPMNLTRRLTGGGDPVGTLDDIIPDESPLFGILDNANVKPLQLQKSKDVLFCKA